MYTQFKANVMPNGQGRIIGDGQCVSLVVNNPQAYTAALYPGVSWPTVFPPIDGARQMFGTVNPAYFQKIANNHNDPSQVPIQGDVMIFDATPQAGYANTYPNPYGHTGICDSASSNGYVLLQQNAPALGQGANLTAYSWHFRPCIGWLRPLTPGTQPAPAPSPPPPAEHSIFLPPTTGPWHLYNDDGPYLPAQAKGILVPSQFGGLTYDIVANKGNGIYVINTQMFGQGAIWTKGSNVTIK